MMSNKLIQLTASVMMAFATMPVAAQSAEPSPAPAASPFQTCKGQSTDKESFHACIHAAKKAAFEKCAASAKFTPGAGVKPTAEQGAAIHQCMVDAGFKHHRHHGSNPNQQPAENQPAQ